jgi:release factor glutamine methyltransferase
MTIQEALEQGTKLLGDASVPAPRLNAEVLLAHALQRERAFLYAHASDRLGLIGWIHFGRYLHERLEGKPTQYITHRQEFLGREFRVTPAVLIPRPETEHLAEAALKVIRPDMTVLDVGTGSGAIAVTLALETRACVIATDISVDALAVAAENARRMGATVAFAAADLIAAFADHSIDVLVSNPPYVPRLDEHCLQREVREYEPHVALFAGDTGLEMYERLIADAPRALRPGAHIFFELGFSQAEAVTQMLRDPGWTGVQLIPDLAGIPRVLAARWMP